jgi:hypothetical protein
VILFLVEIRGLRPLIGLVSPGTELGWLGCIVTRNNIKRFDLYGI